MKRRVRVAAGVVAIRDQRPAHAGAPCIVLLHGFTGSAASWAELTRSLRQSWRVIALDLPGHGDTIIDDSRFDYSLCATADLVAETLRRVGVARFTLVGYSMGGRLALQLALAHPTRVRRMVLESASAGLATPSACRRRQRADEALAADIEAHGIRAFVERWEALPLFRSLTDAPPRARATLRRQRLACSPAGLAASLRGMGIGTQPGLWTRLSSVRMPTLVVVGARDRKFRRIARDLARGIPNARVAVIADAGHIPHLEQPRRFQDAVSAFLASNGSLPRLTSPHRRRSRHANCMA